MPLDSLNWREDERPLPDGPGLNAVRPLPYAPPVAPVSAPKAPEWYRRRWWPLYIIAAIAAAGLSVGAIGLIDSLSRSPAPRPSLNLPTLPVFITSTGMSGTTWTATSSTNGQVWMNISGSQSDPEVTDSLGRRYNVVDHHAVLAPDWMQPAISARAATERLPTATWHATTDTYYNDAGEIVGQETRAHFVDPLYCQPGRDRQSQHDLAEAPAPVRQVVASTAITQ